MRHLKSRENDTYRLRHIAVAFQQDIQRLRQLFPVRQRRDIEWRDNVAKIFKTLGNFLPSRQYLFLCLGCSDREIHSTGIDCTGSSTNNSTSLSLARATMVSGACAQKRRSSDVV